MPLGVKYSRSSLSGHSRKRTAAALTLAHQIQTLFFTHSRIKRPAPVPDTISASRAGVSHLRKLRLDCLSKTARHDERISKRRHEKTTEKRFSREKYEDFSYPIVLKREYS